MKKEKLPQVSKSSGTKFGYSKSQFICDKCGHKMVIETDFASNKTSHKCRKEKNEKGK